MEALGDCHRGAHRALVRINSISVRSRKPKMTAAPSAHHCILRLIIRAISLGMLEVDLGIDAIRRALLEGDPASKNRRLTAPRLEHRHLAMRAVVPEIHHRPMLPPRRHQALLSV